MFHPHLHCVVTGGGLSANGQRWISARSGYFLPVDVLGALFRGKLLAGLKQAYQAGQLQLTGSVAHLACPRAFQQLLGRLYDRKWVVYADFLRPLREAAERESQKYGRRELPGLTIFTLRQGGGVRRGVRPVDRL